MRNYTTLQIGELHTNHCEDYLITEEIGKHRFRKKFDNKTYTESGDVVKFLLVDTEESNNSNMLNRNLYDIQTNWGLKPGDDLAIIRITL
jgi:hypothetical protein